MQTTEQIIEIIERGIDNYDGPGSTVEGCVGAALVEAGITVADCEDDDYAVSEYVYDAMPFDPSGLTFSNRRLAERIAANIITNDGGFVALSLEASA